MIESIARINELRQILANLGYHPYQIHEIIHDCIGHNNVEAISHEDSFSVIACLEEYVSFAQKCRKTNK